MRQRGVDLGNLVGRQHVHAIGAIVYLRSIPDGAAFSRCEPDGHYVSPSILRHDDSIDRQVGQAREPACAMRLHYIGLGLVRVRVKKLPWKQVPIIAGRPTTSSIFLGARLRLRLRRRVELCGDAVGICLEQICPLHRALMKEGNSLGEADRKNRARSLDRPMVSADWSPAGSAKPERGPGAWTRRGEGAQLYPNRTAKGTAIFFRADLASLVEVRRLAEPFRMRPIGLIFSSTMPVSALLAAYVRKAPTALSCASRSITWPGFY